MSLLGASTTWLAAAALTLATITAAVACGSGPEPTAVPTETPANRTPPPKPSPTAAPTPEPAQTAAPAPAPDPTQAPVPDSPAPHPSDAYFALDRVLDVDIEIDTADWYTLRRQTRTLEDVINEIGEGCLSRPFAGIYDWFPARVTVDGEAYADVGVRKKGFLGSQSDTKPALKLRFDKYVDGQSLGGAMERMTLNNSVQDDSLINTCLAYQVFTAAGLPAPRCNFATVSVNDKDLGLYVHVEEIKPPFLARHFESAEGNLYEGTVSDFRPEYRGTFEKKTNEDADDWSDVDAVVAALQDPSEAGWEALKKAVDLDRFTSYWATEVLVGHWDSYSGNRNNYHVYREPDGPFVFIPWGVDAVFASEADPNPFDQVTNPPVAVQAGGAIAHRLYRDADGRAAYVARLRELLDTVWNEAELLESADKMAAIVQQHALPGKRAAAARDTERVREFISGRRAELLAGLEPAPPDWPWPLEPGPCEAGAYELGDFESFEVDVGFETTWGSKDSPNPFEEGAVYSVLVNGEAQDTGVMGATAGFATPEESADVGLDDAAFITIMNLEDDFSVGGITVWLPVDLVAEGTGLDLGEHGSGAVSWTIPSGKAEPEQFVPIFQGRLELTEAGTGPGAAISARFSGIVGYGPPAGGVDAAAAGPVDTGLIINEVAARGDPLDWFELYNGSDRHLALANFVMADDLADAGKRVAFPPELVIPPGGYLQVQLDKEGWPGFALGQDEELGIWTADGSLVDQVDWSKGEAGEGQSYARVPDLTGGFQTVSDPTPGAGNQP